MANSTTVISSGFLGLDLRDIGKGLVIAVIGAALTAIQQALTTGGISTIDWATVGSVSLGAAVSYLVKKIFEPAKEVTVIEQK